MKHLLFLLLMLTGIFGIAQSQNSSTTGSPLRKVLATIQTEEGILYDESCFPLDLSGDQLYMVTMLNGKYYIYENGQRKGPFDNLEKGGYKPCEKGAEDQSCHVFHAESQTVNQDNISMSDEGQYFIKFGGKSFGPYPYIKALHLNEQKTKFTAITMSAEMKSYLVTSDGRQMPLEGDVESLRMSPSGNTFVFAVKETPGMDPAILKMDFSNMTPEDMLKFAKEQEEKAQKAGPPKAWIYSSNSPKLGPFDPETFSSNNPVFLKTGGENWIMVIDNSLYINGKQVKKYEDLELNSCDIWLSNDGKRFAAASYDKIIFSDGSVYPYPIKTNTIEDAGKIIIKWISLENEKDLVLYSRPL